MSVDPTLERFPAFFEQVTGHEPFAWQLELVRRLVSGQTPDVIDVPTGFGKTSALHCWAYALAASGLLPRRLFFVVDRRIVVDATYADATALARALNDASSGVVASVAARLRALHSDPAFEPLAAVRMRGGVTWDSRWLARPDQAAVVVGTVDQFGSRLLMRGYGVSERMRPIDAALAGLDTWLVVDEAHIAEPLVRTTEAVARYQRLAPQLGHARPLQVTRMSATVGEGESILHADMDVETSAAAFPSAADAARERLTARKPAVLVDLTDLANGSAKSHRALTERLGTALGDLAMRVDADARVIGVIANTIVAARAAHERLTAAGESACLLIGRSRAYEREVVTDEWLPQIAVGRRPRAADEDRLFVVATQTIEVGANIDLDALVTECAPLSALIQRFGRVNRIGRLATHRSAIVHAGFAHGEEDMVYGAATAATWSLLVGQGAAPANVKTSARGEIEWSSEPIAFGIPEVRRLHATAGESVQVEPPFIPQIVGAHIERWSHTSPAPVPDQPVEPFLHGVERAMPQVSVAWRAVPSEHQASTARWKQWLDATRPVEWEFVDVPIWELHAFLRADASQLPTSDLDWSTVDQSDIPAGEERAGEILGVIYRGADEPLDLVQGPADVDAGARVILRSDLGGHDRWGWTGRRRTEDEPWVPDIADLAPSRKPRGFRLVEDIVASHVPPTRRSEVAAAFLAMRDLEEGWRRLAERDLPRTDQLRAAAAVTANELRFLEAVEEARALQARLAAADVDRLEPVTLHDSENVLDALPGVWIPIRGAEVVGPSLAAISDDDTLQTSAARRRQPLAEHGAEVGALARCFAKNLDLPEALRKAVQQAGLWHDLGKADPRFQVMLHDGDELAAQVAAEPLAKSGRDPRDPIGMLARRLSRLPVGFRHEAISGQVVRELALRRPDLVDGLDVDLVHHLVVSHHGHARPLLRPITDPDPRKVEVPVSGHQVVVETADQLDWGHPSRFEALNGRYGWWGLALLETLVRLADIRCSEVQR